MFKKIFAITSVAGLLLTGAVAFADVQKTGMHVSVNDAGKVSLAGKVASISGSTVVVSSWGGSWSVDTTGATLKGSNQQSITLSDVKVGDEVKVEGTVSSSSLAVHASSFIDKVVPPVPANSKTAVGVLTSLNVSGGTFMVVPKFMHMDLKGSVNVVTNASTKVFLNGNASTLASLSNDMGVVVKGTYNADTKVLTATTINAYNQRMLGFVKGKGLALGWSMKMGLGDDDK
jgi:hypothetical protein